MPHKINGIVTSFKYQGDLPNVILVGNFHFIAFDLKVSRQYNEEVISPYDQLTKYIKKQIRELSFKGKCAYIETDYFGGSGTQMGEVWEEGKRVLGPLITDDTILKQELSIEAKLVEHAINECLNLLGVYKHEGKDEFDSLRLSDLSSYEEFLNEFKTSR